LGEWLAAHRQPAVTFCRVSSFTGAATSKVVLFSAPTPTSKHARSFTKKIPGEGFKRARSKLIKWMWRGIRRWKSFSTSSQQPYVGTSQTNNPMKRINCIAVLVTALVLVSTATADEPKAGDSPADHLPPHITQVAWFGERADRSLDGKKILFLTKTFGDAMELDLATKHIRNLTAHYPHHGYTRALYLANGDVLLSGPEAFDPRHIGEAREQCWLYVLDQSLAKPAAPLGTKCSDGPAVSRKRMHIAWTHVAAEYPDEMPARSSRMQEADIVFENGVPKLANQKLIINSGDLPFRCTLETQNFRPPDEKEMTFSAYGYQGTDVCGIDLTTKKVTDYSNSPGQYDEPEGIFPDGEFTLVECDIQNHKGPSFVDLWKLKLDGSGDYERLTHFSDYPGFKASNPVVSDDSKFFAFQMATSRVAAGVGHGIFVYDIEKALAAEH
jgi:hypothetical protein